MALLHCEKVNMCYCFNSLCVQCNNQPIRKWWLNDIMMQPYDLTIFETGIILMSHVN